MGQTNQSGKLYIDDNIGFVKLVDKMQNDTALKVVNSARISYQGNSDDWSDKDQKLAKFLWANQHTSPYRHTYYTFHWKAPLFLFRQATKYQVASYWRTYEINGTEVRLDEIEHFYDTDKGCSWNEVSGRYTKLNPEFYIPMFMRENASDNKQQSTKSHKFNHKEWRDKMLERCQQMYDEYQVDVNLGLAKEIARMTLPQNIYSEAYWTVSLQGVLHFLSQRLKPEAQYEIRMYAEKIYKLIKEDLDKLGITHEQLVSSSD